MRSVLVWLFFLPTLCHSRSPPRRPPNILLIMVDDMGIGDTPCYGNKTVPMPHVESLCKEGTTLEHHVTPYTLCTPSRASFQTGRYAIRSGMCGWQENAKKNSQGQPRVWIYTASKAGLPPNMTTIGKVAKMKGYNTGYIGKWHLGLNEHMYNDHKKGPLAHGYDYYFGLPYTLVDQFDNTDTIFTHNNIDMVQLLWVLMFTALPARLFLRGKKFWFWLILQALAFWFMLEHFRLHKFSHLWYYRSDFMFKFLNSYLLENKKVVEKPISLDPLALRLAKKSTDFMERSAKLDKPFLLIHAFAHVHTPLHTHKKFKGASKKHGKYGDALIETDHVVGLLMKKLRELNLEDDTFVYFTSDHGGNIQDGIKGGFNGPFRGGKGNGALEGGMRIPGVIKWPNVVKPGSKIPDFTSNMDILSTVIEITDAEDECKELELDGQSLVPLLEDPGRRPHRDKRVHYHFCESEIFAARLNYREKVYKAIFKEPNVNKWGLCSTKFCPCYSGKGVHDYGKEPLLFDINKDEEEMNPISPKSRTYKTVMKKFIKERDKFRDEIERTKMPSQFAQKLKVMPRPWLQPAWVNVEYKDEFSDDKEESRHSPNRIAGEETEDEEFEDDGLDDDEEENEYTLNAEGEENEDDLAVNEEESEGSSNREADDTTKKEESEIGSGGGALDI